jgi:hypothetical protein
MPAISNKSVAEKLQMKSGRKVLIINQPDEYSKVLGKLPADVSVVSVSAKDIDVVQLFVESRKQLEKELPKLKSKVAEKGMIWVTYPKGTSSKKGDINRDSIAEYALTLGLEGVAIVSVDDDWSALRLKVL